jgi:anti-sigma28 factor (negative regulator of flagellin synthesis)
MKVNDSAFDHTSAGRLGGPAGPEGIAGGGSRAERTPAGVQDTVQLSNLSNRLIQTLESEASARSARIERLAAEVQAGRYHPDAREISRKLIDDALGLEP